MNRPTLEIHNQTQPGLGMPWLRVQLEQLLHILGIPGGAWSITLVDDATMTDLHDRTMNLPTTTDVLTFDLRDSKPAPNPSKSKNRKSKTPTPLDLDTVICVDEAARQADRRHHTVREEILLYAIHSLLHVYGYDDRTAAQARRMHRREDTLLLRLGVGPVYARQERPPAKTTRKGATGTGRRKAGGKPVRPRARRKSS